MQDVGRGISPGEFDFPTFEFQDCLLFPGIQQQAALPIGEARSRQARFQFLIRLNPMTSIVETFRYAFLGAGSVQPLELLYSFGFMVVIVAVQKSAA